MLIIAGLLVSLFVPRRRMWVKAARRPDGAVVLEYAGLARGEDPGLEDAVASFADKHAGDGDGCHGRGARARGRATRRIRR